MTAEEFRSRLLQRAPRVTAFMRENYGNSVRQADVKKALERFADIYLEQFLDDADDILLEPRRPEHQMLLTLLPEGNIFNGRRPFSREKLAAMIVYFVSVAGIKLTRTKLNKLAFYSDFRHFSKHGRSISGSRYKHLQFGPVVEAYDKVLTELAGARVIELGIDPRSRNETIRVLDKRAAAALTASEKAVIDSVAAELGSLTASEVSELSHEEAAYRNTAMGEYIAYGFAELLKG